MTRIIVLEQTEITPRPDLIGQWLDDSHYHTLIEEDCDLYLPPTCSDFTAEVNCDNNRDCGNCQKGLDERNIVFKFRKNFFTQEEVDTAYAGLRDAAVETQNRGIAGGPRTGNCAGREWVTDIQFDILDYFIKNNITDIFGERNPKKEIDLIRERYKNIKSDDSRGVVWLAEKIKTNKFIFDDFVDSLCLDTIEVAKKKSQDVLDNYISDTTYANVVNSGISGWYSRYPRIPFGRSTSYTRDNLEKFSLSYPFLQTLSSGFKRLLPWRYSNQMSVSEKIDPRFRVPETPFTTITVNRNFRTAAHHDAKNMEFGMANLCVMSNNDKFSGGYLVLPEIGYAINIRPRDLLLVLNTVGLHGNTPIVLEDPDAERVSLIAFTHESMAELGSYEYENTRREFVESRRLNKDHPEQRNRWNGISPGLWADSEDTKTHDYSRAKEWYDYLKSKDSIGDEWLDKHHPWLKVAFESNGIEDFF